MKPVPGKRFSTGCNRSLLKKPMAVRAARFTASIRLLPCIPGQHRRNVPARPLRCDSPFVLPPTKRPFYSAAFLLHGREYRKRATIARTKSTNKINRFFVAPNAFSSPLLLFHSAFTLQAGSLRPPGQMANHIKRHFTETGKLFLINPIVVSR